MNKEIEKNEATEKLTSKAKSEIETFALSIGFDLVGFSPAKIDKKYFDVYKNWLGKGMNAGMEYMAKSAQRKDVSKNLQNAKTVISLGINYFHPQENKNLPKDEAIIARYAYGRDYHKIISKKLKQFQSFLKELFPNDFFKSYVDTGPILERAYAENSGIGQIGKNGCIITKSFGSWIFLSEVITTANLCRKDECEGGMECRCLNSCDFTKPVVSTCTHNICEPVHVRASKQFSGARIQAPALHTSSFSVCGTCTRCIDACPTKAIIAPGIIDARKCISYQTIENKGKIPAKIAAAIKKTKRIFGCDICQEVCPHNMGKQKITTHQEFLTPKIAGDKVQLTTLTKIKTDEEFLQTYASSPLMRAKLKKLKSTAKIIKSV